MTPVRPSLFFATIAAGGGHVATARAMQQAVEANFPHRFRTEVVDYMQQLGAAAPPVAALDRRHKEMWKRALQRPWTARLAQRLLDRVPGVVVRLERLLMREFARAATSDLRARDPLLVVSNHGLLSAGLSLAQQRLGLAVPVLTFATEAHRISAYWADPWAERILVPNGETARSLQRMGVSAERLEVVGYPVQRSFLTAPPQAQARASLDLESRFTVLVSLGGEGIGAAAEATLRHLAAVPDWQIVVVCGRNAALRARLETWAPSHMRIEGFTERMAELLAASDVVVGKAGPASVYEALAVGRPVLVTGYAGLNEWGVVQMLEENGVGEYLPEPQRLLAGAHRYQRDPQARAEVERRTRALDLPAQTDRLARRIVEYADNLP